LIQILYMFSLKDSEYSEPPTQVMKLTPMIGGFIQLNELILYLIIYKDLYKHDKTLALNSVISIDVYKSRQKHNSFTLTCQVACFAMEALFIFHLLVLNSLGEGFASKEISFALRVPQFAIQTILQILTSREICEKQKIILIYMLRAGHFHSNK
jgi:hypothetical protein